MASRMLTPTYGLMAEFDNEHDLLVAAHRVRREGYRKIDAFTPFPVEGLSETIGLSRSRIPLLVLCAGIVGFFTGLLLQYWTMVKAYPLNVGGRPLASWPQFIPVAFETTILFASITAVVGAFLLSRLPEPYHPVFNTPNFERASQDRFFLLIDATDPKFDAEATRDFLLGLNATEVNDVAH